MQLTSFAMLSLLVVSSCSSKQEEAPAPSTVPANASETLNRAHHLKTIEIDLASAEAARKANPLAPPGPGCMGAKLSLVGTLSQIDAATLDPLKARYDAACSAIAVDKLDLPADIAAPAKIVQDTLNEVELRYRAMDYAAAEARCMTLFAHIDTLQPSKIGEIKALKGKGDRLCNLVVPIATLDAAVKAAEQSGTACSKERVQNAHTLLARGERLESPSVSPLVAKWNAACPDSALASH